MTGREARGAGRDLPAAWGAVYDGRTLSLSISHPEERMAIERARFGRTLVDLKVKSRSGRVVVQVGVRFGPPLPIRIEIAGGRAWQVMVDENLVEGQGAAFVASHEHEVQFLAAGSW